MLPDNDHFMNYTFSKTKQLWKQENLPNEKRHNLVVKKIRDGGKITVY
jgi:hypothetical protein